MSLINDKLIGMKWRVKEDVLKDALLKKESVKSEKFNASKMSGVKYNLAAEMDDEDPSKVMIFLELDYHLIKKIVGNCAFAVKSATYESTHKGCDFSGSSGWGGQLCKMDELFEPEKKFFVDGYMVVELEGTLKPEGGIKRKAGKLASLCQLLWEREDDKDVTIVAGQKEIKAHKWILCDRSPVFKAAMESSGFKEALENKIAITDFSFEAVKLALEYFYERDIKELINEKNASELIHFADKYNVAPLHDMIQNVLIGKLSDANVCEFANISTTSNAHKLRECSISFLMNSTGEAGNDLVKLKPEITTEICRRSFLSTSA
uniref:BTB domain-containing protein n=1 Tax=Panagrolaimus sp. PS1159 TaxID=55785 RepID=A0AC35F6S5_9BILA